METVRFRDSKSKRPSRRKNHWTRNVLLLLLGGMAFILVVFAALVIEQYRGDAFPVEQG